MWPDCFKHCTTKTDEMSVLCTVKCNCKLYKKKLLNLTFKRVWFDLDEDSQIFNQTEVKSIQPLRSCFFNSFGATVYLL